MEQPENSVTEEALNREVDVTKIGRLPRVLRAYARSIEDQDITCVDSGLPFQLRYAAELIEQAYSEVEQYEARMKWLRKNVK